MFQIEGLREVSLDTGLDDVAAWPQQDPASSQRRGLGFTS